MSEEDNEELDSQDQPTEEVDNTEEDVEDSSTEEVTEDKTSELEEKNRKLFERAKKAETELKELKAKQQPPKEAVAQPSEKQDGITPMDAILLSKASLTEAEDIEEVISYAKYKGMLIKEALKDKTLQAILSVKAEQRTTAEATNTTTARRGTAKPTADQIISNPDKYSPEELAEARHQTRLKK